jgi:uncharacterized membrane protein YdfJ with MMPL/SSD domain
MPKRKGADGRWVSGGGTSTSGNRAVGRGVTRGQSARARFDAAERARMAPAKKAAIAKRAEQQLKKELDKANRQAATRAKKVGPQLQRRINLVNSLGSTGKRRG